MQVIRSLDACPRPPEGSAVTLGFFDGVHLGHRLLIGEARRLAAEQGARSAVVTFDQHPAAVVRPESAPKLLTSLDHRLELLAATGVDHVLVLEFDEARSKESAEDFVEGVLVDCLRALAVVVGADFHFGHRRRGDVALLTEMGQARGFEVEGVQLVGSGSEGARPVSSTAIRSALAAGDLASANRMLGRPHEARGLVHPGDERGRELGFPTANVAVPDDVLLPADGIYAGWYERPDGSVHPAAISLGRRPTFYVDQAASLLEAHLLDFSGDLYGEEARVRFVSRLRGEERYESVEALVEQMAKDCVAARAALS
ncbi:MAG: FMN adenylyltransferase / Riboflavin kinase [uncultured Acidimicrobiales bacterium]|uniref:Riboflavin biosynthesis protein n=1 Tax=uncultured Acidimicrobiales bacterium TaxID=310071 RepID=A0A6J4HHS1_9ACTN|nr:MAG: FMN adenylyltransferase / Riboflavin kinase [uncultured Acidimicrobiales bacterium]